MTKILMILALLQFCVTAHSTPLSPIERQEFAASFSKGCLIGQHKEPTSAKLSEGVLLQFCSCVATRNAEFTTRESIEETESAEAQKARKQRSQRERDYCDEKVAGELKIDSKVQAAFTGDREALTGLFHKAVSDNCVRGNVTNFIVINKVFSPGSQSALCKCQTERSAQLISFRTLKAVATTREVGLISNELDEAYGYCVENNVLLQRERFVYRATNLCLRLAELGQRKFSQDKTENYCACMGEQTAKFTTSWEQYTSLPEERLEEIRKTSSLQCYKRLQ